MADNADIAAEIVDDMVADAARRASTPIAAGYAGECEQCEWWMPRLVEGRCAFCRDGRTRPADWEPPVPPHSKSGASAPFRETKIMPAKSIQLPASAQIAIDAVEARAKANGVPVGTAAAELIEAGMRAATMGARANPSAPAHVPTIASIVSDLHVVFDALVDRADRPDLSGELAAMTARAEAAEEALARVKAAFG